MKRICIPIILIVMIGLIAAGSVYLRHSSETVKEQIENDNRAIQEKIAISNAGIIADNIYIDSVCIGGLTKENAEKKFQEYVNRLKSKTLTLVAGDKTKSITLKDLGFEIVNNNSIENALVVGTIGSNEERYKAIMEASENGIHYTQTFGLSNTKLKKFISTINDEFCKPAQEATLLRTKSSFEYIDGTSGQSIDTDALLETIQKTILKDWDRDSNIEINVDITTEKPKYTLEDIKRCNDIIGTYTTSYGGSTSSRIHNIKNGADKLNNVVIYPGEEFSARKYLAPFTKDNGYLEAKVFFAGKIIDSDGGGACQVVTTLYNALLYSELDITERHAHSMTVSYVEPSMDATITDNYKDLKFINNTDTPILIEAYTKGNSLTFNVWGNETRSKDRKLEFKSVTIEQITPPEDVITIDNSKPAGYRKITQAAKIGYKAELYKIVYQDDKKISEEKINDSLYNATPQYVTVGKE